MYLVQYVVVVGREGPEDEVRTLVFLVIVTLHVCCGAVMRHTRSHTFARTHTCTHFVCGVAVGVAVKPSKFISFRLEACCPSKQFVHGFHRLWWCV